MKKKIVYLLIAGCTFTTCALAFRPLPRVPSEPRPAMGTAVPWASPPKEDCSKATIRHWSDWARQLKANEARAESLWKGQCQRVKGVIKSIDAGLTGGARVVINSDSGFSIGGLFCEPSNANKAVALNAGDSIDVWGVGGPEVLGSLTLKDCEW
jgi:hypothetical protein